MTSSLLLQAHRQNDAGGRSLQSCGRGDGPLHLGQTRPLLSPQGSQEVSAEVWQHCLPGDEAATLPIGPAGLPRCQPGQHQAETRHGEHCQQEGQQSLLRRAQHFSTRAQHRDSTYRGAGCAGNKVESLDSLLHLVISLEVFDKALKELKGGVIQLSSLSSRSWQGVSPSSSAADGQFLEVRRSFCPLPASAVLSSHLATSTLPARVLERNYYSHTSISLNNNTNIQLELRAGPVTIPELTPVCFVKTSVFQPDQVWQRTNVVWSKLETDDQLNALLSFLQLSAKCLVLEVGNIETHEPLGIEIHFRIPIVCWLSCSTTRIAPPLWPAWTGLSLLSTGRFLQTRSLFIPSVMRSPLSWTFKTQSS